MNSALLKVLLHCPLLDAIGGGSAEPGLGGNRWRLGLAETHEQPRLAISDVAARASIAPMRQISGIRTRPATPADAAAIAEVYNGRASQAAPH
jgi:hypothetical protein